MLNQLAVGGDIPVRSSRNLVAGALHAGGFSITGIGMGMFGTVADILYPFFLAPQALFPTHNLVLQVGVDLGLPGLIGWLATLLVVIAVTWRLYHSAENQNDTIQAALAQLVAQSACHADT